ncbi:MAG: hypothetical protein IPP69_14355 [Flavobacteriales bacterium]|nr:hypothetical protein [Flavobacteriales bacterium]
MSIAISFLKVSMVICLAMSILISCKKESSKKTPTCDGSHPTYNSAIKSIINGNCNSSGCHNAGSSNGDFTSYSGLAPYLNNGSFKREVLTNQTMPENGSLSQTQLNSIQCWVNDGYPEN